MTGKGETMRSGGIHILMLCALTAALTATLGVAPAAAHQRLLSSSPADGAVLERPPRELELVFNEPVDARLTRVRLIGPDGEALPLGAIEIREGVPEVATLAISVVMAPGGYTVEWVTTGADGHPVRGSFDFELLPSAARESDLAPGLAAPLPGARGSPTAPDAAADNDDARVGGSAGQAAPPRAGEAGAASEPFGVESPAYVAIRWLTLAALVMLIGAVVFRLLLLPVARRRPALGPPFMRAASRGAARLGLAAAVVLLLAAAARLLAQSAAFFGWEEALSAGSLRTLLGATAWAWSWWIQLVAALIALAGFAAIWRRREGRDAWLWLAPALAAVALAFTPALSGHAAATTTRPELAVLSDALHVAAAGGWVGGLLALLAVGVPATRAVEEPERGGAIAALVYSFSPLALGFAAVLALTGVYAAWLHLGSPGMLIETRYGRVLLLKLLLLVALFAAGAYNHLRVRPTLGTGRASRRLARSAGGELTVGAAVLLVTAVLIATPTPIDARHGEGPAADRAEGAIPPASQAMVPADSARVAETVERFHVALAEGDSVAALALLAPGARILEQGGLETVEEYRAHHLPADIEFASAMTRERGPIEVSVRGDVAWTVSRSRARGEFRGREVDSSTAELMVLVRTRAGWRITAIHWSSR